MSLIAPTMQMFFTERLAKQRQASPATVRSYKNTFKLLLRFVHGRTGKAPSALDWEDLRQRWSHPSWTTSRPTVTTSPAAEMPGSPR